MARGQFDSVMQQSQATQVHKELQETMAQLEAIRYEIRSILIMSPAPFTRRLDGAVDNNITTSNDHHGSSANGMGDGQIKPAMSIRKEFSTVDTISSRLHSQAAAYARLAETPSVRSGLVENTDGGVKVGSNEGDDGLLAVLPVSAKTAGFLPMRDGEPSGSDILLEAISEAEVARKAKEFFFQTRERDSSRDTERVNLLQLKTLCWKLSFPRLYASYFLANYNLNAASQSS